MRGDIVGVEEERGVGGNRYFEESGRLFGKNFMSQWVRNDIG